MVLDQLITRSGQPRAIAGLDQLITAATIPGKFQAFLISCRVDGLSKATLRDYRQKIGSFISYTQEIRMEKLKDITADHIRLYFLKLQETCQPVSVADYYRCLKRFFNWIVGEKLLKESPMLTIKSPKVPKKIIRPFTAEEIGMLLGLCDPATFLGARNRAIILTFYDTGLRLQEMTDIKLKDIDLNRETIKVMGKGARERVVRIGERTQRAILHYLLMREDRLPCLWVTEERKPITAWGIEIMVQTLGQRARLSGVRCSPHTFRHSFGTTALRTGADLREVQTLLGHATLNMTLRYVATVNSENAIASHRRWSPADNLKMKE